ncbi:hypothetical protein RvY_08023 [Ramazzottius varieornatus]|uniref:FIT family protein n=1 Tax=Ramazzottius varieornatus TaxID=947166 RepID=A0A1D1V749_RAMVA|nr:hypothetical protein RvY_08023 [Ramazzottius varieornatus]
MASTSSSRESLGTSLNRRPINSEFVVAQPPRTEVERSATFAREDKTTPPDDTASYHLQRYFHPVLQWILYFSKQFLKIDPLAKSVFYVLLTVVCSGASPVFEPFREYSFFQKTSFLNQYFVKFSWGWTFWLLLVFFSLCGYVESDGRMLRIGRNLTRLVIGTAVWYFVTLTFIGGIEKRTGTCSKTDIKSRKECVEAGNTWMQFDISGHAFLLVYCSLLILEEARGFFDWESEDVQDTDVPETVKDVRYEDHIKPYVTIAIRVLAVAISVLALIWDWMLIVTLVYYHSFFQRILGVALGIVAWFLTYRVWYPRFYPGPPGDMSGEASR